MWVIFRYVKCIAKSVIVHPMEILLYNEKFSYLYMFIYFIIEKIFNNFRHEGLKKFGIKFLFQKPYLKFFDWKLLKAFNLRYLKLGEMQF